MRRVHYAWIIVAVTFAALLVASGIRAAPGALVKRETLLGDYTLAFVSAGIMGFIAVALSLGIRRPTVSTPAPMVASPHA